MQIVNTLRFILNHPLNKKNKFKAIKRWVKWQIGSRLFHGPIVFEWVRDSKFYVKKGDVGLTQNIYTGLHEFPDMSLLLHFIKEEDLFIDIGANVGSYTVLACGANRARGFAFEPVPSTYKKLEQNVRLNHMESLVQLFNIGLGNEEGELPFTSGLDSMNHALSASEVDSKAIAVKVRTLDSVLIDELPTFIKIDVEGYETPVIEGSSLTLDKNSLKIVIIELNGSGAHYKYDENNIYSVMQSKGFEAYSYDPFTRVLLKLNKKNEESGNTIFIRDVDFVNNRIKNSDLININGQSF